MCCKKKEKEKHMCDIRGLTTPEGHLLLGIFEPQGFAQSKGQTQGTFAVKCLLVLALNIFKNTAFPRSLSARSATWLQLFPLREPVQLHYICVGVSSTASVQHAAHSDLNGTVLHSQTHDGVSPGVITAGNSWPSLPLAIDTAKAKPQIAMLVLPPCQMYLYTLSDCTHMCIQLPLLPAHSPTCCMGTPRHTSRVC